MNLQTIRIFVFCFVIIFLIGVSIIFVGGWIHMCLLSHAQILCGTSTGELLRINTDSGIVTPLESPHNRMVTSIHPLQKENQEPILYTTSMDASIAVRVCEVE